MVFLPITCMTRAISIRADGGTAADGRSERYHPAKDDGSKAHTWFVADRTVEGGAMEIYLNNYRTDKTGLYNKLEEGVSFAQNGDLAMADDQRSCKGLDEYVRQQIEEPKDNALRTTTWELTKLAEKPVVEVVEGLEWANGSSPQVRLSEVKFDPATGKATITVETNGWARLRISNLKFVDDPNAEEIKDNAGTSGQKVNVAKRGRRDAFSSEG